MKTVHDSFTQINTGQVTTSDEQVMEVDFASTNPKSNDKSKHYEDGEWICTVFDFQNNSKVALQKHSRTTHNKGSITCKTCEMSFNKIML